MPTILSTSADRPAISCFELTPCARIASLNCAPIDLTGLSAFIALCMTTDRSRQRTAASCLSVSPTMLRPLKITLPPVISAGGASSWAMANSSVDLPQPDSPTIPMNSPGSRSKLTCSTAVIVPRSRMYSTERSPTSSTLPVAGGGAGAAGPRGRLAGTTDSHPDRRHGYACLPCPPPHSPPRPQRPQGGIADLVKGIVEQGEGRAEGGDASPRDDGPQVLAGLQGLVVLRPVQHRAPAHGVGIAQADELQAGAEQHRVQRVGQEAGDDQRCHGGNDLDQEDVHPELAPYPGRLEEVPAPQRQRLRPELARGVGPPGEGQHQHEDEGSGALHVGGDDDEQREQRD